MDLTKKARDQMKALKHASTRNSTEKLNKFTKSSIMQSKNSQNESSDSKIPLFYIF